MPVGGPLSRQSSAKVQRYVSNHRHAAITGSYYQLTTEFTDGCKDRRPLPPTSEDPWLNWHWYLGLVAPGAQSFLATQLCSTPRRAVVWTTIPTGSVCGAMREGRCAYDAVLQSVQCACALGTTRHKAQFVKCVVCRVQCANCAMCCVYGTQRQIFGMGTSIRAHLGLGEEGLHLGTAGHFVPLHTCNACLLVSLFAPPRASLCFNPKQQTLHRGTQRLVSIGRTSPPMHFQPLIHQSTCGMSFFGWGVPLCVAGLEYPSAVSSYVTYSRIFKKWV